MDKSYEFCKGYPAYSRMRVYVIKKPFITWKYVNDNEIQIGYIDNIAVCAVNKKGYLSRLEFLENGEFETLTGATFFLCGSKFKHKLNAMKAAYLHIPMFFKLSKYSDKIKPLLDRYYGIYYNELLCKECNYPLNVNEDDEIFCEACNDTLND